MRIGISSSALSSKPVHRAAYTRRPPIEDMSIDHGRLDIFMAQELLDRSDVVTAKHHNGM